MNVIEEMKEEFRKLEKAQSELREEVKGLMNNWSAATAGFEICVKTCVEKQNKHYQDVYYLRAGDNELKTWQGNVYSDNTHFSNALSNEQLREFAAEFPHLIRTVLWMIEQEVREANTCLQTVCAISTML
ncbi:MAG: hypothetical protein ACE5GV_06000 [Candidatus Scalindua sp.]